MDKALSCVTVLSFIVGAILITTGFYKIDHPGLTLGYLTPAPVDWDSVRGYWIVGGLLVLWPFVFFAWAAISTRRAHPGKPMSEVAAIEDQAALTRAGWVDVKPVQHSCSPPMFTGPRAKRAFGIGSIWECPTCRQRWRLLGHEAALGTRGKGGSSWGLARKGK
jgi:hypothetical protein